MNAGGAGKPGRRERGSKPVRSKAGREIGSTKGRKDAGETEARVEQTVKGLQLVTGAR